MSEPGVRRASKLTTTVTKTFDSRIKLKEHIENQTGSWSKLAIWTSGSKTCGSAVCFVYFI